jgi:UDP-N-acetylmuramyl pentapeptide phosphotransferase/UDP-N-acetylglucosamine-1-phosphate transferase
MGAWQTVGWAGVVAGAAACAWLMIAAIRPWLVRHATAHPNARSSHVTPTPQGAGAAVAVAALAAAVVALTLGEALPAGLAPHSVAVAVAVLALMTIGLLDDIAGLGVVSRLGVQALALGLVVATLPVELRPLSADCPFVLERVLIFLGGLWFLNLYNFMDGIDLISVTETVAIAAGVALLALAGAVPAWLGWTAGAVIGATLGFAPWNMPPAKLFLGDAGSLTLGLLTGVLLMHVAATGLHAAAWILPLYYLSDATITVVRRIARRENLSLGHRSHFYQAAMRNGFTVPQIVARIATLNVVLIALALVAAFVDGIAPATLSVVVIAIVCVVVVLWMFSTPRRSN